VPGDDGPPFGATSELAAPELSPELLARLPERDADALAAFFDAYFPRVYGYLRRLVRDEHRAEDLTQDVFVHVYRAFPTYDPARPLRPWVFTIATNKLRDHWRSRAHKDLLREESVEAGDAENELSAGSERPDTPLAREELDRLSRDAVDALPEGLRVPVVLRVWEDLSFEAIGEILERNEVAVRKRYSRALEVLRASLGAALPSHLEGLP
jgi:RNA polymerase sigma-70 factor (ECF subfamily)